MKIWYGIGYFTEVGHLLLNLFCLFWPSFFWQSNGCESLRIRSYSFDLNPFRWLIGNQPNNMAQLIWQWLDCPCTHLPLDSHSRFSHRRQELLTTDQRSLACKVGDVNLDWETKDGEEACPFPHLIPQSHWSGITQLQRRGLELIELALYYPVTFNHTALTTNNCDDNMITTRKEWRYVVCTYC